jgi:inorganic triphosphatase YgiF
VEHLRFAWVEAGSWTSGLDEPAVERVDDGFGAVAQSEFREDMTDVRFHRYLAHDQFGRDLGVGRAGPDAL